MKARERNDSSDMSAQGQASINLHKWRVIIGETQSEDVQERERPSETLHVSPHLIVHCLLSMSREHRLHNLKQRL